MPTRRRWFAVQAGSTATWFDDRDAQVRPLQGLADIDRPGLNLEDAESGDEAQGRQAGQDPADDIGRDAMAGEDQEPEDQKDDGDTKIREVDHHVHVFPPYPELSSPEQPGSRAARFDCNKDAMA